MNKNLRLTAASAFMIAAAALISPLANAAYLFPKNDTTPVVTAPVNLIAQGTVSASVGFASDIVFQLPSGIGSLALNDQIEVTLTNGLVWSATTPTLTPDCTDTTATWTSFPFGGNVYTGGDCDIGAGTEAAASPLLNGAAGDSSATWRVVKQMAAGDGLILNANASIFDVSGLAGGQTGDVQIAITAVVGGSALTIASGTYGVDTGVGGLFTATNIASASVTTLGTNEAEVTQNYTQFNDGTTATVGTVTGNLQGDPTTVTVTDAVTASSIPSVDIPVSTVLYTIAGNFDGVDSVTATGVNGATGVATTECGTPTTPVVGGFSINTTTMEAYACNSAAVAPGAAAGALSLTNLTFTIDGVATQQARSFLMDIALLSSTNWSAYTIATGLTVYTIQRNGSFFSTNSSGDLNTIKITDRSGALGVTGGEISIAAYDAAGLIVTQAAGTTYPNNVASNGTTIISGADVRAAFPGAVRFDFTVNSADIIVSNVKKNADGITNNQTSTGTGGSI